MNYLTMLKKSSRYKVDVTLPMLVASIVLHGIMFAAIFKVIILLDEVDALHMELQEARATIAAIHGNLDEAYRTQAQHQ